MRGDRSLPSIHLIHPNTVRRRSKFLFLKETRRNAMQCSHKRARACVLWHGTLIRCRNRQVADDWRSPADDLGWWCALCGVVLLLSRVRRLGCAGSIGSIDWWMDGWVRCGMWYYWHIGYIGHIMVHGRSWRETKIDLSSDAKESHRFRWRGVAGGSATV